MSPLAFGQYVLDVPERTVDTTGQDFDVHVGEVHVTKSCDNLRHGLRRGKRKNTGMLNAEAQANPLTARLDIAFLVIKSRSRSRVQCE